MDREAVERAGCGWLNATAIAWCQSPVLGGRHGVSLANRAAKHAKWKVLMLARWRWMVNNGHGKTNSSH